MCRAQREHVSRNAPGSPPVAWTPRFDRGPRPASSGTICGSDRVSSIRGREATEPDRGFTVACATADTKGEGHAEAGHDQSGDVGGRGSTVPRFENRNCSTRQAVPPLRQARGVLHALHPETAGQPGTAPRPVLPVPPRSARRLAELRGPRRLASRRTTVRRSGHDRPAGNRTAIRVHPKLARPGWFSSATQRSTKAPVSRADRPISSAETGCIARAAFRRPWRRLRTIRPLSGPSARTGRQACGTPPPGPPARRAPGPHRAGAPVLDGFAGHRRRSVGGDVGNTQSWYISSY